MWRIEYWTGQTLVAVRVVEAEHFYISEPGRHFVFTNKEVIVCIIASIPGMVVTRTEDKDAT